MEENIIDQIVEKCSSGNLRKKILKGGDNMTLHDIIIEANLLESVNRQMNEFDNRTSFISEVNEIVNKRLKGPTKKIKCHNCSITGHFQRHCLTKKDIQKENQRIQKAI